MPPCVCCLGDVQTAGDTPTGREVAPGIFACVACAEWRRPDLERAIGRAVLEMRPDAFYQVLTRAIERARERGDVAGAERLDIARAYFTNPDARAVLEEHAARLNDV